MPIKSLSSALKASKISGLLLLRNSQDPIVSSCVRKPQSGTWKNGDAISSCENDIIINEVCGNGHVIGMALVTPPYQKSLKTNPQKITRDIFQSTTNQLITPIHLCPVQSCLTAASGSVEELWINYVQQDFSWASLITMPINHTSFCLASTYETQILHEC